MSETTAQKIERLLRAALDPISLELTDDSARHVGHAGASSGGGHYSIVVVSSKFEGLSRLARHRLVYETLGGMIGPEVHALAMRTIAVSESSP